jgi:hypothetical protein
LRQHSIYADFVKEGIELFTKSDRQK